MSYIPKLRLCLLVFVIEAPWLCLTTNTAPKVLADGETISFSLLNYNVQNSAGEVLEDIRTVTTPFFVPISVTDVPSDVFFILIQVHPFLLDVILSYSSILSPYSYVNGTHIGLVYVMPKSEKNVQFFLRSNNAESGDFLKPYQNVSVLFAVQAYGKDAPIPGGCNMEFSVEIAPYMRLTQGENMIVVDSQLAMAPLPQPSCELQVVTHDTYHMFLPEQDFSEDTYFSALRAMMSVAGIRENAKQVSAPLDGSPMRRMYSSYPGTGSVYGTIAIYQFSASAYVPTLTYACGSDDATFQSCSVLTGNVSKVLSAVLFFVGLFVCLLGHRVLICGIFFVGFLIGAVGIYVLHQYTAFIVQQRGFEADILMCLAFGISFGIISSVIWTFLGIPVVSVLPALLCLGFLMASVAVYAGLGDVSLLESDINFWLTFTCVMLGVTLLLISVSQLANIVSCAVLGSYAVIVPIDHYVGSNLKFIFMNSLRRIYVKGFNKAVVDPPFQYKDTILAVTWLLLAVAGVATQFYLQRGRPPFPPPRQSFRRDVQIVPGHRGRATTERTPLLADNRDVFYTAPPYNIKATAPPEA